MMELFTTTTACVCGDVASVGLGDPLCATTTIPAMTATIVKEANNQIPQVPQKRAVRRRAAGTAGTLAETCKAYLTNVDKLA